MAFTAYSIQLVQLELATCAIEEKLDGRSTGELFFAWNSIVTSSLSPALQYWLISFQLHTVTRATLTRSHCNRVQIQTSTIQQWLISLMWGCDLFTVVIHEVDD